MLHRTLTHPPINTRGMRKRLAVAAAVAVMLAAASPFGLVAAKATVDVDTNEDAFIGRRVTVTVALSAGRVGSFRMTGVPDRGRVDAKRTLANGMLRLTQRLTGARGVLVISSTHSCGRATGRWKVTSGTGAYRSARREPSNSPAYHRSEFD